MENNQMENRAYSIAKHYASNGVIDLSEFVVEASCVTRQEDFCNYIGFNIVVPQNYCDVDDIKETFNFRNNPAFPGAHFSDGNVYIIADENNYYGNVYIRNGLDV